jgi:hypothetical protein
MEWRAAFAKADGWLADAVEAGRCTAAQAADIRADMVAAHPFAAYVAGTWRPPAALGAGDHRKDREA